MYLFLLWAQGVQWQGTTADQNSRMLVGSGEHLSGQAGKMFSFGNGMRTRLHAQTCMGARTDTMAGYEEFERERNKIHKI